MKKVIQNLWKLLLFSFPFSLNFILFEEMSYRFGNFNPWVTGFVYLPEILLFLTFSMWFIHGIWSKSLKWSLKMSPTLIVFLLFILNAGVVSYFQGSLVLFAFLAFKVLEGMMFYVLLRSELTSPSGTVAWLLYGAVFQFFISFFQRNFDQSLGLNFIGEPRLSPDVSNVAKIDLSTGEKGLRGYGTFLHPNILAAYFMTILLIALSHLKKAARFLWIVILVIGIWLTGSLAAQVSFAMVLILLVLIAHFRRIQQKKLIISLTMFTFFVSNAWVFINSSRLQISSVSIQERLGQNIISLDMFLNHFWGVGVAQFTLMMENFAVFKLKPWEFQPVHNVYFLILNETGIQGFILLIITLYLLIRSCWKNKHFDSLKKPSTILPIIALIFIASFDHLLITSYIGPFLIALAVYQSSVKV